VVAREFATTPTRTISELRLAQFGARGGLSQGAAE